MEDKFQTARELSLQSGLSEDAAIVMLSKLDEKDREIARLRRENDDLRGRVEKSSGLDTVLRFVYDSWEPIIILSFVILPFVFILLAGDRTTSSPSENIPRSVETK